MKSTVMPFIFAVGLSVTLATQSHADSKRVMVFGDSNSWGWSPVKSIVPTARYPTDKAWPGVMARQLGNDYEIINESLSGRTAGSDDASLGIAGAGMNGLTYLPAALASNAPLDLVVIMLGTNDVKPYFDKTTFDISLDILRLASEVSKNAGVATSYQPAKVMIVVPPHLGRIAEVEWLKAFFPEASVTKSAELAKVLGPLAQAASIPFLDAGTVTRIDGIDGVHMSEASHNALGLAVAEEVKKVFAQ